MLEKTLEDILPICMNCGNVGLSDGTDGVNFCHMCGVEGTCVSMERGLYALFLTNFIQNRDPNRSYVDPFNLSVTPIKNISTSDDNDNIQRHDSKFNILFFGGLFTLIALQIYDILYRV